MKRFVSLVVLGLVTTAKASQFFSAHFCQPYKNGGTPAIESYYQNQGSVLAAAETTLTCPLHAATFHSELVVRVFYSSFGIEAKPPIACRVWKISQSNQTLVGLEKHGVAGVAAGYLDVYSNLGPSTPIGANVECRLKPGAKILGYYLN